MDTNNNNSELRQKLIDVNSAGVEIELSVEEAELMGAFFEDALSLEDAMDAMYSPDEDDEQ